MNKNLNPSGALDKTLTMSIPLDYEWLEEIDMSNKIVML
jgi:hypothetical protein